MRYIDADALLTKQKTIELPDPNGGEYHIDIIHAYDVKYAPTADVVEVRHGTWYHGTDHGAVYAKCSACGRKMNYSCYGYAYCALCGAKMDGKRREK